MQVAARAFTAIPLRSFSCQQTNHPFLTALIAIIKRVLFMMIAATSPMLAAASICDDDITAADYNDFNG
jgi:type III secretory pathway component EscU